jgi:hypothetical protein
MPTVASNEGGPTAADLAEIEAEWPVISAEMDLLDAEIAAVFSPRPVSAWHWRRVRTAERAVIVAWLDWRASRQSPEESVA